jgi:hypothetical protein
MISHAKGQTDPVEVLEKGYRIFSGGLAQGLELAGLDLALLLQVPNETALQVFEKSDWIEDLFRYLDDFLSLHEVFEKFP